MTLTLTIENEQSLPNGAPVSVRLDDKRSLDIGRAANLGWTLPDPTRFISGRHCELRHREGAYWLNDLSTNGTFLNGGTRRMQGPHRLRDGDRLTIGPFVIAVAIEGDEGDSPENSVLDGFALAGCASSALAPDVIAKGEPPALSFEHGESLLNGSPSPAGSASLGGAGGLAAPPQPGSNDAASWPAGVGEGRLATPAGDDLSTLPFNAQALEIEAWAASDRAAQPSVRIAPAAERWAQSPDRRGQALEQDSAKVENSRAGQNAEAPAADEFLRSFAKGAGVPEQIFARQDPMKVAEDLGALMRLSVENLTQLLSARFKAKRFARTSSQTMIQALDNNPLKFAPTSDDALKIMFGPRTSGYLEARRAFEGAFKDLKTHQVNTFAAMQQAVRMLVEDLDPQTLEEAAGPEGRLAGLLGSRKRRLWDLYVARWQAKTLRHQDGLVDAFMLYFAECYDEAKDPNAKS